MHKFNYRWTLKDANFTKDKGKVFSTFSCGGGTSLGYQLAGFDVIGNLEFDEKKNATYNRNNSPKYSFCEDIRKFRLRDDIPEELYHLDILSGSPPCFLEGELVMTSNGFKEIQDIQIGDYVLTHTNSFQRVINVMSRKTQGYYDLKVQGCVSVLVTENHPFYVRTMIRKGSDGRLFSNPSWKAVKELDIKKNSCNTIMSQDYIGVAINQNAIIPQYEGLEFNEALIYIIGRWFGDGWLRVFENKEPHRETARYTKEQGKCRICGKPCRPHKRYKGFYSVYCSEECKRKYKNQRKKNRHSFIICCGKDKVEEMKAAFDKLSYNYTVSEQRTTYRFSIENKKLVEFMMRFGRGAANKHLTKDILDLPVDLLEVFLNGYMDADGCYDRERGVYRCASISKQLIYGIQACVHKVYHTPTRMRYMETNIHIIEGREVNTHPSWHLSFKKESVKQQHAIYEDGYLWIPYREKFYVEKEVTVYNISVENDESYTINNLICHNCLAFSMSGDREAVWGKDTKREGVKHSQTWDDLFFEYIALAKKLQPKVVEAENVKGLLIGNAIDYVRRIYDAFDDAGYYCQHFLLNTATMGVPQKRERVFFICLRKDLAEPFLYQKDFFTQVPKIDMTFKEPPIPYGEFADYQGDPITAEGMWKYIKERQYGDVALSDAVERKGEPRKFFNQQYLYEENVSYTLTAHRDSIIPYKDPRWLSKQETCSIATFPQDYDFGDNTFWEMCGRAVPCVCMANIATNIYEQWLSKL